MMNQDAKKPANAKKEYGDFNYTPQDNGSHVDKSYGKNMGQPMQPIIGTEKVENPFGKGK
jgi:hypothetical protein